MNRTQVAATTVTNIGNGHRKFYTIYVVDSTEIRQWGRIGTAGQFQHKAHASKREAERSAEKQIGAKKAKGYGSQQDAIFGFDLDILDREPKDRVNEVLHNTLLATTSAPTPEDLDIAPMPDQPQSGEAATQDPFESFNERALNVISSAASGHKKSAVEYARLREEFTQTEEGYERAKSLLETLEVMLTSAEEVSA